MIVMKFGGSSLATSDALTRVAGLIADRAGQGPVVVVSAMGKTTDGLVAAVDLAGPGGACGRPPRRRGHPRRLLRRRRRSSATWRASRPWSTPTATS